MNSLTLFDCSSLALSATPIICVLDQLQVIILCKLALEIVTASANTGCVAPEAPWKGCVGFSYLNPKRSKPFV